MKKMNFARTALAGAILMGAASAANAFTVTFGPATDSDGVAKFYDPASNTLVGLQGMNLALGTGADAFKSNEALVGIAQDANDFTITCTLCVITKVTLTETGTGSAPLGSFSAAQGKLTADGSSQNTVMALYSGGASGPFSIATSVAVDNKAFIAVNVNNSLFSAGGGSIEKLSSVIDVEVTAIPLPPAAWMLGSALVGLVTVGRRKLGV